MGKVPNLFISLTKPHVRSRMHREPTRLALQLAVPVPGGLPVGEVLLHEERTRHDEQRKNGASRWGGAAERERGSTLSGAEWMWLRRCVLLI